MADKSITTAQVEISFPWNIDPYRVPAFLSALAVYFISYIPFLYIIPYFGIDKITLFIIIVLSNLTLLIIAKLSEAITGRIEFQPHSLFAICLYVVFAVYALCSYAIIGEFLNDIFTIRTLTIVNPVFALFALASKENKKNVLGATFILSFIYFVFFVRPIFQGNVQIGEINILGDVFEMDERLDTYQNVNMYLGLFVISILYFISRERIYFSILCFLLCIFSITGMFLIGGRTSIIAVAVVLFIYFSTSPIVGRRLRISSYSLIFFFSALIGAGVIAMYWNDIIQFFQQSITVWRFSILLEGYDASGRLFLFTKSLELFLTNIQTFLFGAGINSFPVYIGEGKGMYPHNVFLELLCEYGLVGFILFLLPIVYILHVRKKQLGTFYGDCKEENIVFLLAVYFWVHAMFTGDVGSSWVLLFFSFLLMPSRIEPSGRDKKRWEFFRHEPLVSLVQVHEENPRQRDHR